MKTDAELVNAVLDGEREAYACLVARYERAVRATVLAIVRDHHCSQDVAQETFVLAFEKLGRLRDPASFGGWAISIARNLALTARRRRLRLAASQLPADPVLPAKPNPFSDESETLLGAVVRLPVHERVVVMLKYFDGHSVTEIARMIDRPVGTITVQLSRARERLRGWLKEFES